MRTWIRPMIIEECFVSNENIANSVMACYKIACKVGRPDNYSTNYSNGPQWKENEHGGVWHESTGTGNCSDANSNRVLSDGMAVGTSIQEYRQDLHKWLDGGIDTITPNQEGEIGPGAIVYWHTQDSKRRWNHWGKVELADASRPNHS